MGTIRVAQPSYNPLNKETKEKLLPGPLLLLLLLAVEASQRGDEESWQQTLRRLLGQAELGDNNASDSEEMPAAAAAGAQEAPATPLPVDTAVADAAAPATPLAAAVAPPTPVGPEGRSQNVDRYRSQNSDDRMHSNRYSPYETYSWEIAQLSTESHYLVDPAQDHSITMPSEVAAMLCGHNPNSMGRTRASSSTEFGGTGMSMPRQTRQKRELPAFALNLQ